MVKYIAAALLAGSLAVPAYAQEAEPFSGVKVEGLVGYDTTDVEGTDADGLAYGLGVGFDKQSGKMVFGIEGEATESELAECVDGVVVPADTLCARVGRDLYAGGRIGAVLGSRTLLYAKAGYTNARVKTVYDTGVVGTEVRESENLDGVRVGAGLEFAFGGSAFAKAEYRYSNYEQGFDRHQGLVGVGLRF
ncbi:MAG TPA: porin family protein [Allosphingosinicella sp.]|nr:porin family protein [Allosphingosinicella sp.]